MASSSKICRLSSKIHSLTQKLSKTNVHISSLPSPIKSSSPSSATSRINQSFRSVFFLQRSNLLEVYWCGLQFYIIKKLELGTLVWLFLLSETQNQLRTHIWNFRFWLELIPNGEWFEQITGGAKLLFIDVATTQCYSICQIDIKFVCWV